MMQKREHYGERGLRGAEQQVADLIVRQQHDRDRDVAAWKCEIDALHEQLKEQAIAYSCTDEAFAMMIYSRLVRRRSNITSEDWPEFDKLSDTRKDRWLAIAQIVRDLTKTQPSTKGGE